MLSNVQRRSLEAYRRYREFPPTFGSLFLRQLFHPSRLLMHAIVVAAYVGTPTSDRSAFHALLGLWIGVISQGMGYQRLFIKLWPMYESILDWGKIDELLKYGSLPEDDFRLPTRQN